MAGEDDHKYPLGAMRREAERLHKQHVWVQACLNNQIVFAPIDLEKPGLKVLDVGCADGIALSAARWCRFDSPLSPRVTTGQHPYATGDVCEPPAQELTGAFDLTHLRYVLVGCGKVSIDTPISNLVATLAPGGWLQVQELDVALDEATHGPAFADLLRILGAIWNKTGPGADCVNQIGHAFARAGLQNVKIQRIQLPAGKKLGNERDSKNSLELFKLTIPNISQGAKALGLDLPASVFDNLEERFEREMLEQGATFTAVMVYGQKSF